MFKKATLSALFAIIAATLASPTGAVTPVDASRSTKVAGLSQIGMENTENSVAVLFAGTAETHPHGDMPALLTSVIGWLSSTFDLPATNDHPRIEFASPMKLIAMRYKGVLPQSWREDSILDPSVSTAQLREVVAIYNDSTRTIFLPRGWSGKTPAEQSVLVHEMVHHLQNVGRLKYECPAAREKLAYQAQSEWLRMHGLDLEKEFDLDMMTVLVSSACMN